MLHNIPAAEQQSADDLQSRGIQRCKDNSSALTFILASLCGAGRTFSKGSERKTSIGNNSLRNAINPRLCLFLRDRDAAQISQR